MCVVNHLGSHTWSLLNKTGTWHLGDLSKHFWPFSVWIQSWVGLCKAGGPNVFFQIAHKWFESLPKANIFIISNKFLRTLRSACGLKLTSQSGLAFLRYVSFFWNKVSENKTTQSYGLLLTFLWCEKCFNIFFWEKRARTKEEFLFGADKQ